MGFSESYARTKAKLLNDEEICKENRDLFAEFFQFEEYKLKRIRGNSVLDENSYKTLLNYTHRLRAVNRWFKNKNWRSLTKEDIQRVYDDVEDGKITKLRSGKPFRDKHSYYRFILRGKPFEMAGKKELVKEVMQYFPHRQTEEVRFIREEDFRRIIEVVRNGEHRLFLWLCFDIGENSGAILRLRKRDCIRKVNIQLNEPEYAVNLRREILKRSRRARTELTNYRETAHYLDAHLSSLADDDLLFNFGEGGARKLLLRAAANVSVRCQPGGQRVTLKDLRSSMACDLLSKGWSRDEMNARLGHTPSSSIIDKYINYLALDRVKPKRRLHEHQVEQLMLELAEMRDREKLLSFRFDRLQQSSSDRIAYLQKLAEIQAEIVAVQIDRAQHRLSEQEFARALVKCHGDLVKHEEQGLLPMDSSEGEVRVEKHYGKMF